MEIEKRKRQKEFERANQGEGGNQREEISYKWWQKRRDQQSRDSYLVTKRKCKKSCVGSIVSQFIIPLLSLSQFIIIQLKSVYYSLIHSHLSYCINTWGSALSCNLKPLKILQKHIIRLIAKSEYRARSSPLFSQLQILQLEDIYTIEVAKHMYKFSTNQRSGL